MSKLREYKSIISSVILTTFISLHCSWTFIRCSDDHTKKIGNQKEINNKNKIDHIINEMENNHTWTIFKIIITPGEGGQNIDNLIIEDIVSKEYINNENNENNKANAFLLNEEEARTIKGTIGINNNENININNAILNDENSKDNNKNTYYVLVKDIATKKDENDFYITLFSTLKNTAIINKFTYSIEIIDANTTEVTDMSHMFDGCRALTEIKGLDKWNTSSVTDMSCMFAGCEKLTEIKGLDNWDTRGVKDMSGMFNGCKELKEIKFGNNWNTNHVTGMSWMFYNCFSLTEIVGLDKWDTSNVTIMMYMFYACSSLKQLTEISNWDTKNVTDMSGMFNKCKELTEIEGLENWKTDNVKNWYGMFDGCTKLNKENIPDKFR